MWAHFLDKKMRPFDFYCRIDISSRYGEIGKRA